MALTDMQSRFVSEYLIDLNATQAAIRAGYSGKGANRAASRLLSNVDIQAALQEAKTEREKRTGITQDKVLAELARIGFADIRKAVKWGRAPDLPIDAEGQPVPYPVELVPSDQVDDDTAAAITEVSLTAQGVKIKMADKRAALETLLKHMSGVNEPEDAPALSINITSDAPVKDVRVTRSKG